MYVSLSLGLSSRCIAHTLLPLPADLSQDILESVVEGPEGDAVFEVYAEEDELEKEGGLRGASALESSADGPGVDEAVLKDLNLNMDRDAVIRDGGNGVIVIDD